MIARSLFLVAPLVASLLATPLAAQDEARNDFIADNLIAIFYHELGHALIYRLDLPIFGQEEDAADVASVMLIDGLYENDRASEMVIAVADSLAGQLMLDEGTEIPFWGVHGVNQQRYYNTICIFYGGDPGNREEMITLMGLPEERAQWCFEEYDTANRSWGVVLDEIALERDNGTFHVDVRVAGADLTVDVIGAEVEALNRDFGLEYPLAVVIDECGVPNAYFSQQTDEITMCAEFETFLGEVYDALVE